MSGLDSHNGGSGGYLIEKNVLPDIQDLLRGLSVCLRAGARFIGGAKAASESRWKRQHAPEAGFQKVPGAIQLTAICVSGR
jgi:hypothetical protein